MSLNVTVDAGVAVATLNRPDAMNAFDPELRAELQGFWTRIDEDDDIHVVILTGAGDRAFCAGADLKKTMPPPTSQASAAFGPGSTDHLLAGLSTDKPLIAAINGFAIGGGLEIALATDIRIAAEHAKFGLTEAKIGSIPGAGGTQMLPRVVGRSMAMQMMLTGELIDAEAALACGLVSEVMPLAQLMHRAREIAAAIAANAPLSVRAIKRLVNRSADLSLETGMELERFVWGLLRDSEDRIEGRKAFQEKRPPRYQGR